MTPMKIGVLFLISLAFAEVATWTIDLPEVRKYFFEKAEKDERRDEKIKEFNQEQLYFDNIKPDSPHNKEEYEKKLEEHHEEYENDVYGSRYAEEYEYMSYMEKKTDAQAQVLKECVPCLEGKMAAKAFPSGPATRATQPLELIHTDVCGPMQVHGIVHNGTVYLEGLRRALEDYGEMLKNCSRLNFTLPLSPDGPWLPQNERPQIDPNTPISIMNGPFITQNMPNSNFQNGAFPNQNGGNQNGAFPNQNGGNQNGAFPNQNGSNPSAIFNQNGTFFNQNFTIPTSLNNQLDRETCERATRASEHVRRLAELALWATRELQDKAYNDKYDKPDHEGHEEEEEDLELLLRLAFFLDRLAFFTGFVPEPKDYITTAAPRTTTTSAPALSLSPMGPIPEDVKTAMMECLQTNSSQPADQRCRYPLRHPEFVRRTFNMTDSTDIVEPITEANDPSDASFSAIFKNPGAHMRNGRSKRDILTTAKSLHETLTAHREKRSVNDLTDVKNGKLNENPVLHVMKYYVKHKVWENSNPDSKVETSDFDVANHLTAVKNDATTDNKARAKRSIDTKKYKHMRLPEDPMQDISSYVKHKSGVNYIKDETQTQKLKDYFEKIRHSDRKTAKYYVRKMEKTLKSVQKRSIKYEDKFLPTRSQDPRQDISYYVKNKEGTDYEANLVQAARVRQGLEEAYQTGNIEVIRRFGGNYNPLVPAPLAAGIARSFFEDI